MFILIVQKQLIPAPESISSKTYHVLAAIILPFAPWEGMTIHREPDELVLEDIVWDTTIGYFHAKTTQSGWCAKRVTPKEAAEKLLETTKWGAMATSQDLVKVREEHVKQAIRELQQTLLRRQKPQVINPQMLGMMRPPHGPAH